MGPRGALHVVLVLLLQLQLQLQSCLVLGSVLTPRQTASPPIPTPLSIEPSQDWDGIDGRWNTFYLRIGTPEQVTRALISTASQQTWAVFDEACYENKTDPNSNKTTLVTNDICYASRGATFDDDTSTTWSYIGFYQLWLEKNLGLWGNGKYGYETVGLGYSPDKGPTLLNTTVGAMITENFWLGHFGINPKPTNFSAFTDPSPSYMTKLWEQSKIPSVSWGYTAGAEYRLGTVLASLTLGGYDSSRFIPNDLTFEFAPDNERDIVVGVVEIRADSNTKTNVSLLDRDPFTMYIDSTVAELFLPVEVCKAFERELGLKYDEDTQLYLVDDLLHETLLADNATITFSLGQKFATNMTADIRLPYAALDMVAKPPYKGLMNSTRYFPIRRSEKENAFVLGRTFLQEAYLIVDWERQNFSVSQNKWVYGEKPNIVPITSPVYTGEFVEHDKDGHKGINTGAIIGIAIGAGFGFAMLVIGIGWWFWRRRAKNKREEIKAKYAAQAEADRSAKKEQVEKCEETPTSPIGEEGGTKVFPKAELPAEGSGSGGSRDSKDGDSPGAGDLPSPTFEVDNTERQIFEMPGDIPARLEADGRQLSEKESMMVREARYNGVDPYGPPPVSPTSPTEPPRRPPPLSPSDVAMVNRRMAPSIPPSISPTSPRTPRDGASLEANDTFFHFQSTRTPRDGRFLEAEDTLLSPISPLEDTSRRRFSYES